MKVGLIIPSMHAGGAERVASVLVNRWVRGGWTVFLLTLTAPDDPPFYELDPGVKWVPLGVAGRSVSPASALLNNMRRVWTLRKVTSRLRPDVLISFMDTASMLTVLSTRGLGIPVVVCDRNNPQRRPLGTTWRILREPLYRRANAVVLQTERAKSCFSPGVQARSVVIPNPVRANSRRSGENRSAASGHAIVAAGRLTEQKGFDLLVSAFGAVAERYPDWRLIIVGEGPLRADLERLAGRLGIADRIQFPGRVNDLDRVLRMGEIFVLSSRYEGFPNVLCEAMACGLAVISTDCPFGPSEIIQDGVDGILVPNEDVGALTDALGRLMGSEGERRQLESKAPGVVDRLGVDRVNRMWEDVIQRVLS